MAGWFWRVFVGYLMAQLEGAVGLLLQFVGAYVGLLI